MTSDLIITDSHVMTPNGMVEKNLVIEGWENQINYQ